MSTHSQAQESPRAAELIERLQLKHLNVESGLFNVLAVSDLEVQAGDGASPASNAIYLMLSKSHPQNYVQWLYSDDYQVLIEGGPADYYLFYEDGRSEKITMGRDLAAGQQMIVPSPGGTAKAIVLHDAAEFLLVGSILSPAWSPQRARIGGGEEFLRKFGGSSDWATEEFLRELIGPNFGEPVGASGAALEITLDELGQFIWQEMQLTEKQLRIELRRFIGAFPGEPLVVRKLPGTPAESIQRLRRVAEAEGVRLQIEE